MIDITRWKNNDGRRNPRKVLIERDDHTAVKYDFDSFGITLTVQGKDDTYRITLSEDEIKRIIAANNERTVAAFCGRLQPSLFRFKEKT